MPGAEYIGQFGNPWTSMQGIMAVRQQIHDQQQDLNKNRLGQQANTRANQQQGWQNMLSGIDVYNKMGSMMSGGMGGGF